jgi:hypothetical protein
MMKAKSKLKGLFQITGDTNVGKTSFALQGGYDFKQIAYFNFDGKEPDTYSGMPLTQAFGFYRAYLPIMAKTKELSMIEAFLNDVAKVKPDVRVAIIDNEEFFRKNFHPYTLKHKNELKDYWFGRGGTYKVMEELGFAKMFESVFFSALQDRFDQVIVINHLEDARDDTAVGEEKPLIPGKKKSSIKTPLIQRCKARFWLVNTDGHLCPSAIVVKNPGFQQMGENGIETITVFPPKLSPFALPDWKDRKFISIWDVIAHYETNPFSEKFPKIEQWEMLSEREQDMVSEELTDNDKQLIEQFALVIKRENHERVVVQVQKVLEATPKAPAAFVKSRVSQVLPDVSVTVDTVQAIMDELKGE